jgi:hypothetical protein
MVNDVIDAISIKLNATFGDGYTIYTEQVEQGLKEPCFLIYSISPSHEIVRGNLYAKSNKFVIQFFPLVSHSKKELNDVVDTLFEELEYITTVNSDLIRGSNMSVDFIDDVANFFVNYDFHVTKVLSALDKLEELQQKIDLKKE